MENKSSRERYQQPLSLPQERQQQQEQVAFNADTQQQNFPMTYGDRVLSFTHRNSQAVSGLLNGLLSLLLSSSVPSCFFHLPTSLGAREFPTPAAPPVTVSQRNDLIVELSLPGGVC